MRYLGLRRNAAHVQLIASAINLKEDAGAGQSSGEVCLKSERQGKNSELAGNTGVTPQEPTARPYKDGGKQRNARKSAFLQRSLTVMLALDLSFKTVMEHTPKAQMGGNVAYGGRKSWRRV